MSDNNEVERPLDRRLLLRGGAVLAGAAGIAVAGAAMGPTAAHAADGDPALLGQDNEATTTTTLNFGGEDGSSSPALEVTNPGGPVLKLSPVSESVELDLKLGELAVTREGPQIGVYDGSIGAQTTFLATGLDLDQIPITLPIPPERVLDTRSKSGRAGIRTTSPNALNSSFQLNGGSWLDVAIAPVEIAGVEAVFLNVAAVAPAELGYITAYPPGDKPGTSTVNFDKGRNTSNSTFILVGVAKEDPDWYVVRIFSRATTHLVVDLTGVSLLGISAARQNGANAAARQRAAGKSDRMVRRFRTR